MKSFEELFETAKTLEASAEGAAHDMGQARDEARRIIAEKTLGITTPEVKQGNRPEVA